MAKDTERSRSKPPAVAVTGDEAKRPRIAFDVLGTDENPDGIDWEHVRESKRPRLKALIQKEARKDGWGPKDSGGDGKPGEVVSDKFTAAQAFMLLSMGFQGVGTKLQATPEQTEALGISAKDAATLNRNGMTDAMIAKYFPDVKIALEVMWSLAALEVLAPKCLLLWALYQQAKAPAAQKSRGMTIIRGEQVSPQSLQEPGPMDAQRGA